MVRFCFCRKPLCIFFTHCDSGDLHCIQLEAKAAQSESEFEKLLANDSPDRYSILKELENEG